MHGNTWNASSHRDVPFLRRLKALWIFNVVCCHAAQHEEN